MAADITLWDYLAMRNLAFEWAESYDTKDWDRLKECFAPSIRLDFRSLRGALHDNLSPDDYVDILVKMIGDKRLRTQHLIGAAGTECLDDGTIKVEHQIRVAHQRHANEDPSSAVINKGHGHGVTTHWYKKTGNTWKIVGVSPKLHWAEYDLFGTLSSPDEQA